MSTPKEKKPETFHMVLYECPYCGKLTLKSVEAIRADDAWTCPNCGTIMKVAY